MAKNSDKALAGIFEEVQSSSLLPKSRARLKILSATADEHNGKRRFSAQLQVVKPKDLHGRMHFVHFYVGTTEDPQAVSPETWKDYNNIGARQMKEFLLAAQVEGLNKLTPSAAFGATVGKYIGGSFSVRVDNKKEKKDGSPNPYFGQEQQQVRWFEDWKYEYGIEADAAAPAKRSTPEPEEEDEEEAPAPKAAPKGKKAKPEPEPDEDEEEEEEEEEDDEDEDED